MKIGCINVRTLGGEFCKGEGYEMASDIKRLPEFLTEFRRLGLQIVILSETRVHAPTPIMMMGYTCYFSELPQGSKEGTTFRRIHGVGIVICDKLVGYIGKVVRVNPRIMWIAGNFEDTHLAVIANYSPTLETGEKEGSNGGGSITEEHYDTLTETFKSIPNIYKKIMGGDMNATIAGADAEAWEEVIGPFGLMGEINHNGRCMLGMCQDLKLVVANSFFYQGEWGAGTYHRPGQDGQWDRTIDYILVPVDLKSQLIECKVVGDACIALTDHRLIIAEMRKTGTQGRSNYTQNKSKVGTHKPHYDIKALSNPETKALFNKNMIDRVVEMKIIRAEALAEGRTVTTMYEEIHKILTETMNEVIPGKKTTQLSRKSNWFDEYGHLLQPLIDMKRVVYGRWQQSMKSQKLSSDQAKELPLYIEFMETVKQVKLACRKYQNLFYEELAKDLQVMLDNNEMIEFYKQVKTRVGIDAGASRETKIVEGTSIRPIGMDGMPGELVTGEMQVLPLWVAYFSILLNQKSVVDVDVTLRDQEEVLIEFDEDFSLSEFMIGVTQMKNDKATGESGIPNEVIKIGMEEVNHKHMLEMYTDIFDTGIVPQAFKDSIIIVLYKQNGDATLCTNYRGLCINEHGGKLLERLILNRILALTKRVRGCIPISQCGFVQSLSTMNAQQVSTMVAAAYLARGQIIYKCYVDLVKAYDVVNRELLWKLLGRLGFPPKLLRLIKGLHEGARGKVRIGKSYSDWFDLTLGLRQGAIFSPTLFNLYSGEMIRQMKLEFTRANIKGIRIRFRKKGELFRTINAADDVDEATITEILFADDLEFLTTCAIELQQMLNIFDKIVTAFGGKINTSKTQVMMIVQDRRQAGAVLPEIMVQGVILKCVEEYTYLGTLETRDNKMNAEVSVRCQKMRAAYFRYNREIFQGYLDIRTKVKLFNIMVVTNGLYGCQVWSLTMAQLGELEATFFSLMRRLFRKKKKEWSRVDMIQWGLEQNLSIYPMEWRIAKLQLRYLAHEMRIPEDRVPMYQHTMMLRADIVSEHTRLPGRGEQQYKDTILRAAKACGIEDMSAFLNISANKPAFNKYMKEVAQSTFLERWLAKETQLRAQRREYELARVDNERILIWARHSIAQQALEYVDSESDEDANDDEEGNIEECADGRLEGMRDSTPGRGTTEAQRLWDYGEDEVGVDMFDRGLRRPPRGYTIPRVMIPEKKVSEQRRTSEIQSQGGNGEQRRTRGMEGDTCESQNETSGVDINRYSERVCNVNTNTLTACKFISAWNGVEFVADRIQKEERQVLRQECNNNIQITITNSTAESVHTGYLRCHELDSGAEQVGMWGSTTSSQSVEGRVEPERGIEDQAGRIESERKLDTEPVGALSRQRKQLLRRRAQHTRKRFRNEGDSTGTD